MDKSQIKAFIAARVAKELKDGDVVYLYRPYQKKQSDQ